METYNNHDKTTVDIDVMTTIARLTTLQVPGVSRMSPASGIGVKGLFKRNQRFEGVLLVVKDDNVYVDLFVALNNEVNVRDVCRIIQIDVSRAISDMVGMQVGHINVHVEDIDYPLETEA